MSKRRRRSEASEGDVDEYPSKKRKTGDKWTVPTALNRQTELCNTLYEFLRRCKDSDNKYLSECLIRAPSRRMLPSYYEVVSQPIDLIKIQQKLRTDEYRTVELFLNDIRLLFTNTKLFYPHDSEEHRNTVELEKAFTRKLADCGCGTSGSGDANDADGGQRSPRPSLTLKIPKSHLITPPTGKSQKIVGISDESNQPKRRSSLSQILSSSGKHGGSYSGSAQKISQSSSKGGAANRPPLRLKVTRSRAWVEEYASSDDPVKIFMASVYDYHDGAGSYVAEVFHELPSRQDYPEYYRVITEPLDLNIIKKNTEEGRYMNLKAIQDDMILLVKNAHHFNEPGCPVYKAASSLRKFVISKCAELERKFQTVKKTMVVRGDEGEEEGGGAGDDPRRKVPKLKLQLTAEGKVKGHKSRHSSSSALESQSETSDGELSSDEEDSAGGVGIGGGGTGKLLMRIKKQTLSSSSSSSHHKEQDPVAKVLKIKKPPLLKKKLLAIYRSIVIKMDEDGRFLCELFMKRPSATVYPQYYLVIKNPIDLKEILQKIRSETYLTMEEMISDVDLMVENACTFNEEDSQVYKDATVLKGVAKDAYQRLLHGWGKSTTPTNTAATPTTSMRGRVRKASAGSSSSQVTTPPGSAPSGGKCPVNVISLYTTIKTALSRPLRQYLWLTFKLLPPDTYTDYYASVKRPIDMQTINGRYARGAYQTLEQLLDDMTLLCDNAYGFYSKTSKQAKDAVMLLRATVTKYKELKEDEGLANPTPHVPQAVQKLLREIVSRTLSSKDPSIHDSVESLKYLVVTKDIHQDTGAAGGKEEEGEGGEGEGGGGSTRVRRRFDLAKIRQWTSDGRYTRLQQLQDDLLAVFKLGRRYYGSQAYYDSFKLERAYLKVRDELCKDGSLLWSPALDYTTNNLDAEMSSLTKAHYKSPSPPPSVSSTSSSSSDSASSSPSSSSSSSSNDDDDNMEHLNDDIIHNEQGLTQLLPPPPESESSPVVNEQGLTPSSESVLVPGLDEREYVEEWEQGGVVYRVGDVVHLMPISSSEGDFRVEGRKAQVVVIENLWKDRTGAAWLNGCWFFHPEETFHLATRKFYKKEVFKSDFHSMAQFSQVIGKTCVLFLREYLKYLPKGYSEDGVYVCESRYAHKSKSFKKIKNWLPLGPQPDLVPRDTPPQMDRLPSIFATTMKPVSPPATMPPEATLPEGEEFMEVDDPDTPICDNLVNVRTFFGNTEPNCTYYEQYCIDNDYFRLGDFVYLRSDQDKPFIARIDKMWTDANGDPWIRGPWFICPSEVVHSPTRMFYDHELFMSNIQDTNPMLSICGKCAVMNITDYCKKRPTEYAEHDVYLTESRYHESDKEIKKAKPLKHFELSESSIVDEVYNLPEELRPLKVPSPQLFSKDVVEDDLPSRLQHLYELGPSTSTSSTQSATPPLSVPAGGKSSNQGPSGGMGGSSAAGAGAGAGGGGGGTVLNIPQHLLQKLLASASQISTTRPVVIPLQQAGLNALAGSGAMATPTSALLATTPTSLSSLATTSVTPSQTKSVSSTTPGQKSGSAAVIGGSSPSTSSSGGGGGGYTCTWDGCGKVFPNVSEFGSHLLCNVPGMGHITKDPDGNWYCRWRGCPRNPSNDGRPFDTTAKLMRHLREVHLMKMSHSVLGIPARGERSSASSSSAVTVTTASVTAATPSSTQSSSASHPHPAAVPSTSKTSPVVSIVEKPKQTEEIAPIMRPPSVNRRQAVHSDIYKKYIKGLESDSQYMSTLKSSREIRQSHQLAPSRVRPTDWIDAQALKDKKDSASLVDALWALRDQLLKDSLNISSGHQ